MVRGGILVPLLQHPSCAGACCPVVRSHETGDCVCSATSELSEGQGLLELVEQTSGICVCW